ncbi:hypothetical protein WANA31_0865 [Wolbachia endosymbiont of Drosophila ananassae]|nr:hypothetical protein WANA31_0865 [Wolbachia endosymbiont of Drosophila ananassae]RLT62894.1 hypothetical protein WANA34_0917 [Wolbachia endosymbiont of Drosophila ananassae]
MQPDSSVSYFYSTTSASITVNTKRSVLKSPLVAEHGH